jgi:hypothetical protein
MKGSRPPAASQAAVVQIETRMLAFERESNALY